MGSLAVRAVRSDDQQRAFSAVMHDPGSDGNDESRGTRRYTHRHRRHRHLQEGERLGLFP